MPYDDGTKLHGARCGRSREGVHDRAEPGGDVAVMTWPMARPHDDRQEFITRSSRNLRRALRNAKPWCVDRAGRHVSPTESNCCGSATRRRLVRRWPDTSCQASYDTVFFIQSPYRPRSTHAIAGGRSAELLRPTKRIDATGTKDRRKELWSGVTFPTEGLEVMQFRPATQYFATAS